MPERLASCLNDQASYFAQLDSLEWALVCIRIRV